MNEDLKLKPSPLYVVVKTVYILLFLAVVACGVLGVLGVGIEKEDEAAARPSQTVISCEEAEIDGIDCL